MDEVTQEQQITPVEPTQETEQEQDQQVKQAIAADVATLEHCLDTTLSNEHSLVVLAVRLAVKAGYHAGIGLEQATDQRFAAIDLPAGQVWWYLDPAGIAALEGVPLYDKPLEQTADDAKYQRVLAG